jgi:predicted acetyltransferase
VTIEIRPVPAKDLRLWFETINRAFGEDLAEDQLAVEELIAEPERTLGAYDGEKLIGGGGAFTFRITVPGGATVGAAGVTGVGVLPTHRRQGALRALMARQLADVRALGEPIAALWASEGSIYQRFGYGLAAANGSIEIARDRAQFRRPVEARGTIELRDGESTRADLVRIYDAVRARTPGFFTRRDAWWDYLLRDPVYRRRGATKRLYAIHVRDGQAQGYAMYRVRNDWGATGPANVLVVAEVMALDETATQQLWRYLFGIDLMGSIQSRLGPADHPLLLMVAEPRRLQLRVGDGLWVRIVDVPAALSARAYAADDSIVLDVVDEFMPEVGGSYRLTTRGGAAEVKPTSDAADLQLDVADLAAVYLGGFTFASLGRAGRTTECVPDARARADAMFATTAAPWCAEVF